MPEKQKGILNKITNLYASLDGYASGPTLTVNKQSNSKSIIGSTLTLLTIALTFYLSWDTISNVLYVEGPKITYDSEQGTANISDINFTNFFTAYSFFTPKENNTKFSNITNNRNITHTMTTFLGDCIHDCNNYTFLMGNCNATIFSNISLKGLPLKSSQNISDIFKEYSFCLPDQFKATLLDDDITISDFVSSFSIYIPDTYNQSQKNSISSLISSNRLLTNTPAPAPEPAPTPDTKTPSAASNTQTDPAPAPAPAPSPDQSTKTDNTNSNPGTNTPAASPAPPIGESCPPCQSYETCSNGKCVTQNAKGAIVANVQTFNTYDNPTAKDYNDVVTIGSLAKAIREKIENNIYPRMFIITQGIEIFPTQSQIVQTIYNFNNLDFRDKITGIPYQYDVYVQKIKVKLIKPKYLFSDTSGDDDFEYYFVVSDIVINNMLGNDPTKAGVTLYFKVDGTTQIIYITYNNFNDILNDLGSYFAIFDLVAKVIAMLYADFFLQADLLNSVFCFNEYDVQRPKNTSKKSSHTDDSENYSEDSIKDNKFKISKQVSKFNSNNEKLNQVNIIPYIKQSNQKLNEDLELQDINNQISNNYIEPKSVTILPVGMGKNYDENKKEISLYNNSNNIEYINDCENDLNSSRQLSFNNNDISSKKLTNKQLILLNSNNVIKENNSNDDNNNAGNDNNDNSNVNKYNDENLNITNPSVQAHKNSTNIPNKPQYYKLNNLIKSLDEKELKKGKRDESKYVESNKQIFGIKKKYKILLNSLSFNEENKLENNIINKYDVTPYDLMFECCYKKYDPRKKAKYELYKKCLSILEKTMNIEYIIRKDMEVNFIKEYLLNQTENNMFKYHFKPLNVLNFDDSMDHLKKLKSEGVQCLTKDELINEVLNGNNKIFEVFFDYHAN